MTADARGSHAETLEAAARELGERQRVSDRPARALAVWTDLDAIRKWLVRARAACLEPEPEAAKAAEWLLDNDYLVDRALLQVREDLPPGFYRRLPALAGGDDEGLPRVFALAQGLLRASHLQLSLSAAVRFVDAYQDHQVLTIAELWAFPTMLRLACLELLVTALERLVPEAGVPFAPAPLVGATLEIHDDTECVARGLANLGIVSSIPWKDFFARTSRVEAILRRDPADVYSRMDFETCDRYRRVIEDVARAEARPEPEVAERVVALARGAAAGVPVADHVGHWLVGAGRAELERSIGHGPSFATARRRWLRGHAVPLYGSALAVATAVAAALPALYLAAAGAGPGAWLLGMGVALLPASVVGITLVHWATTRLFSPRVLPKLDFAKGIPADSGVAVVMPVLVAARDEVTPLLHRLERHHLANPDPRIQLALLTDHADAPEEQMPDDDAVLEALVQGIRALNERHGSAGHGPFHVLHRPRRYNPAEGCWMGWERKRGKLEELNDLLGGGAGDAFSLHEGDPAALRGVRFVVTVDADTVLPPGSVARLAGTLAHPLNRADFDERTGEVRSGYTVVQPRVEISPEASSRSPFARLCAGDTAIDVYTRAVSDVYQDLFGIGIFVGKGIYDVAAFRRSLRGRVPENALASHDLFEGIHGRAALASDIVLYEGFPSSYLDYSRRWHRWLRGDWALLPWLGRRVPARGRRLPGRLSWLARWMILDNLRRSLLPPALVALLAAGWLLLPGSPWVWTALAVAAPGAYLFSDLVAGLARLGARRRGAVRTLRRNLGDHVGRWAIAIVFLAQDAAVALDAIGRTLWRVYVSRRRLLQWTTAAHTATKLAGADSRALAWRQLWLSPALALALGAAVALGRPAALPAAAPLLLLWLLAPEIATRLARTSRPQGETLGPDDRAFLRHLARRTWLFFETFVGPEDHWLPPDNFQEDPGEELAHRTSPTNVGMMLLSSLAARDLGYLGLHELAARLRNSLDTLDRIPRYRGHLFNWYDTRSLEPLEPRYVSSVDSGNLAVSLLAVKEGCREGAAGPAIDGRLWDGLADGLALLTEALASLPAESDGELQRHVAAMSDRVSRARAHPGDWPGIVARLCERDCPEFDKILLKAFERPAGGSSGAFREVRIWIERVHHHLRSMQREIETLLPWWARIDDPPAGCETLARNIAELLPPTVSLEEVAHRRSRARRMLAEAGAQTGDDPAASAWRKALGSAIEAGARNAEELRTALLEVAARLEKQAWDMDFRLLYDEELRLFHIGYNTSVDRLDPHHYDLLATEARLTSFFAIVKGDVPAEHWVHLGRPLAEAHGHVTLVSWGGSMFEYLMPSLLLRSHRETLLAETERAAVDAQRRYARRFGVPWGISESGFASLSPEHHYRYRAFGVPGLGLRRGLSSDLVVAPYASALALSVLPEMATANLRELARLGMLGCHGFFEAADFTPERVPEGRRFSPVRSYMAHHQGMILAALDNALRDDALARRFHADRRVQAVDLLLDERLPRELPPEVVREEEHEGPSPRRHPAPVPASWTLPSRGAFPRLHALGNGRLSSWISDAGGGGLRWREHVLTRWLPDATCDDRGLWVYLRDEESQEIWSATRQPTGAVSQEERVTYHAHLAEFHRHDHGIALGMEVGVAPADDLEIRRLTVVNESDRPRRLVLTSYGEVVLAPPAEDERHLAFSKLFVGSEFRPELDALLFERRPRRRGERPPYLLHRVVSEDEGVRVVGFESDRRAFLGRNGDLRRPPGALGSLAGAAGWTLDAVMALQVRLELEPGARCQLAFLTMAAGSRESLFELAERHATLSSLDWALADARTEAARELQRLGLDPARLPELQTLGALVAQPHPALRGGPDVVAQNRLGQPRLWRFGISGDLPVVLLRVADRGDTGLLRALVQGHQLWRRRGIQSDLVVLRAGISGYAEPLRERLFELLGETGSQDLVGRAGGIHLLIADQVSQEERWLLESVARVVLDDRDGPLEQQLERAAAAPAELPRFGPVGRPGPEVATPALPRPADLLFDNGFGGFSPDGREYVIHLEPGESTPAPWSNVLANDDFGSVVTESGGGFTWAGNSGENRLTPWTCDPVADPPSEALYLRDEETAAIWTPTPRPAGQETACQIRHGAGYTEWHRRSHGFAQHLRVFVPPDDPVKVVSLELENLSARPRRITITYYAEWLLGAVRSAAHPHVVSEYDPDLRALLARNPWAPEFEERAAFLASSLPVHGFTADRQEFLGREGDAASPAGLVRWGLSSRVEPGSDACAALQVHLDVPPGEAARAVFVLGQGRDREHADGLVRRWRDVARVDRSWEDLGRTWDERLGAVHVKTPDPAFDLMVNRWLPYQAMASRILARAALYQAGGAIGFRDQLQDHLALLHADAGRVRRHLLACAGRQFEEGDVLHWWHPPSGRGVRTRCSDDLLWLPFAVAHYVEATGDASILEEPVPFLRAAPLAPEEDDRYATFETSPDRRSVFEHCERALERGVTRGAHGLPLIGAGDWNDGMDRVGRRGRGESVWLAWFAIATLRSFAGLCERRGDAGLAERWGRRADELARSVEQAAWDGSWYVRAFDDDGRPWGSASGEECRIDSIAQSWAVLSGAADPERARQALASAEHELVREDTRLVRLLWPPFDATPRDPGYIKAYPPGLRENGGQYTHAAAWLGWAFARLGDRERAARIVGLLNPIGRALDRADVERYRVEPYVLAGDVGSVPPHEGQGGWTWYTGAAAWTYRLSVEAILGIRLREGRVAIDPCLPPAWDHLEARIRGPAGFLDVHVEDPDGVGSGVVETRVDGRVEEGGPVEFPVDGSVRRVQVRLGRGAA